MIRNLLCATLMLLSFSTLATNVRFITSAGDIEVALYDQESPVTVSNFLRYVANGSYKNSLFHRVINGFMIQGGGFNQEYQRLPVYDPIKNESRNGKLNRRGTIAMARTSDPNSATRQFFFNHANNTSLNGSSHKWGYAVFGEVIKGIEVVDFIANAKVRFSDKMAAKNVPVRQVIIEDVIVIAP